MARKDAILKLRIPEDLKNELSRIADERGDTISVIVREALRAYLDARLPRVAGVFYSQAREEGLAEVALVAEPKVDYHPGASGSPFLSNADAAMPGDSAKRGGGTKGA